MRHIENICQELTSPATGCVHSRLSPQPLMRRHPMFLFQLQKALEGEAKRGAEEGDGERAEGHEGSHQGVEKWEIVSTFG